ncbi:hypothetical protein N0V83_005735 [Neocucurbitaria cava]|uniref:ASX DEUBAD domain-containing protein n=1 Tax=Neocucurbitaria cava TaxID=798079 RepID=A0A9W9CMC9_9PLEO|nr:hypothetical protein N0V83_005735 [Neocucurbitaria cava]
MSQPSQNSSPLSSPPSTPPISPQQAPAPKSPAPKQKAPPKPTGVRKAAPKKVAPTPTSSNRPTRTRKAPERFGALEEKAKPKTSPPKKGSRKVFDPVFITTNSTSRLGKADVYHMLLEGSAWTSLSTEQQHLVVAMLPQDATNRGILEKIEAGSTEGTRPRAFSMANDCFRTDVAKFKQDLVNGHLAKTWQAAAAEAVVSRAAGEYDQWKAEEAELWWGQKGE